MLTAGAGRLREWALFAALALLPAGAMGVLGLRALASEETTARRELSRALEVHAERAAGRAQGEVERAARALDRERLPADAEAARAAAAALAPPFAEAVVLGADRALLAPMAEPAGESGTQPAGAPSASALSAARCRELAEGPAQAQGAERAQARAEILRGCQEARSATGRWIWPVIALDELSAAEHAAPAPSGDALAAWLEAHASRMSAAERDATAMDLQRNHRMDDATHHRCLRALTAERSARGELERALRGEAAAAALRGAFQGLVRWRGGGTLGVLRVAEDGRLAGFVVHRASLRSAVASGWLGLPPDVRATVAGDRAGVARGADAEGLGASAEIAPGLTLRIAPADPRAVERRATRSRRVLAGIGVGAAALAFGLAALLFARMRAARRSSQLRTDFVATVSHELRTPIASIRMLAELLEEGRVEDGERAEVHEALAREARRLGETVERLLGFSRMAAGRHALARRAARVSDAVAASIDTFEERHPDAPRVVRDLDPAATAPIDAGQIRLAVDNLLANALKYAPEGGPYRVRVAREGKGVAIRVEDQGPGVARRDLKRIFEPFERADDRLSRATEGSGIGLSLVRHVAQAHGGRARVESERGRGATFVVWIPRSEA